VEACVLIHPRIIGILGLPNSPFDIRLSTFTIPRLPLAVRRKPLVMIRYP
jgi:hypothetical protein